MGKHARWQVPHSHTTFLRSCWGGGCCWAPPEGGTGFTAAAAAAAPPSSMLMAALAAAAASSMRAVEQSRSRWASAWRWRDVGVGDGWGHFESWLGFLPSCPLCIWMDCIVYVSPRLSPSCLLPRSRFGQSIDQIIHHNRRQRVRRGSVGASRRANCPRPSSASLHPHLDSQASHHSNPAHTTLPHAQRSEASRRRWHASPARRRMLEPAADGALRGAGRPPRVL